MPAMTTTTETPREQETGLSPTELMMLPVILKWMTFQVFAWHLVKLKELRRTRLLPPPPSSFFPPSAAVVVIVIVISFSPPRFSLPPFAPGHASHPDQPIRAPPPDRSSAQPDQSGPAVLNL